MLTLVGCKDAPERDHILSDSTLVVVLADLHLADARARLPGVPPGLRDSVLAYHGITEADFEAAMSRLSEHPDDAVNLYNSVLDRLNASRTP